MPVATLVAILSAGTRTRSISRELHPSLRNPGVRTGLSPLPLGGGGAPLGGGGPLGGGLAPEPAAGAGALGGGPGGLLVAPGAAPGGGEGDLGGGPRGACGGELMVSLCPSLL